MTTLAEVGSLQSHNSAITRWAKFGPYYAMFPIDFAFEVVEKYSKAGDYIIDPFAGRCSSIYAGGILGRNSLGIEINPLGWLYGTVKLSPAPKQEVIGRLFDIYNKGSDYKEQAEQMPLFFQMCFCPEVLQFLLAARENLNWQYNSTDGTLMSILLVYLHGKLGEGLSNQMRQTKAMGVNYSINWWNSKNMNIPPSIDPVTFFVKKIDWRYAKDIPPIYTDCSVIFGDSTSELGDIIKKSKQEKIKYSLLFTSPPYWSIVNYHTDQWLRLWLLGGEEFPKVNEDKHKGRFNSKIDYQKLLESVFSSCAEVMSKKSTIFVRTDAREFTFQTTLQILSSCFPKHQITINKEPFKKKTQTELFNGSTKPSEKYGEIDIILQKS